MRRREVGASGNEAAAFACRIACRFAWQAARTAVLHDTCKAV
jgi:hypothetical protein